MLLLTTQLQVAAREMTDEITGNDSSIKIL